MHEDIAFLCLVYAIEAYHRRNKTNEEIPDDEHQDRLSAVIASAPQDHKEWLRGKLAYSNEPSLRKRLKGLLKELDPIISNFTIIPEQFIQDLVTKRNYLVHSSSELADQVSRIQAYKLKDGVELLLDACILRELGMGAQAVTKILQKSHIALCKE